MTLLFSEFEDEWHKFHVWYLLFVVALMDSLDSTYGGKATSQEYKAEDNDMHTIVEASESRIDTERRDDTVISRGLERDNSLKTGTGG